MVDLTRLGEFGILTVAILVLARLIRPIFTAYVDERKRGINLQEKTLKRFEDGDTIIDRNTTVIAALSDVLDKSVLTSKIISENVVTIHREMTKNTETLTSVELDLRYLRSQYDKYYAPDGVVVAKLDELIEGFNELQHAVQAEEGKK